MFRVRIVARPDARMVEVPLEIEAELPRDFDGAALLSSSGLPRKVRLKAQRDVLKLSTAYRADQLLADLVRTALRGTAQDAERVQAAARSFVRTVRERRQDGATLLVESNGRGKIDVTESLPPPPGAARRPAQETPPRPGQATVSDRVAAIERRLAEIEGGFATLVPRAEDSGDRVSDFERRIAALEARPHAPGVGEPLRGTLKGRGTALDAFAEGYRAELRQRVISHLEEAEEMAARCDRAATLAVEAERVLGSPAEGISEHLRVVAAQAAARAQALERIHSEVDLYPASDLPLAERLVSRLVDGPHLPDPAGPLERQAQALVRAARGAHADELHAWLTRAAVLCGWELIEPPAGEPLSEQLHVAVDSGGDHVAVVAAPGVRRKDGAVLCRARVLVSPEARASDAPAVAAPPDSHEVELLAEEEDGAAAAHAAASTAPTPTAPSSTAAPTSPATSTADATSDPTPDPMATARLAVPPPLSLPGAEGLDGEAPQAPQTDQPGQVVGPPPLPDSD